MTDWNDVEQIKEMLTDLNDMKDEMENIRVILEDIRDMLISRERREMRGDAY